MTSVLYALKYWCCLPHYVYCSTCYIRCINLRIPCFIPSTFKYHQNSLFHWCQFFRLQWDKQRKTVVVPSFTLSTQLSIACFSNFSNRRIWRQQGNQGDEWHVGQATISTAKNWLLVITATVGNGYRGDIAIDDVLISVSNV